MLHSYHFPRVNVSFVLTSFLFRPLPISPCISVFKVSKGWDSNPSKTTEITVAIVFDQNKFKDCSFLSLYDKKGMTLRYPADANAFDYKKKQKIHSLKAVYTNPRNSPFWTPYWTVILFRNLDKEIPKFCCWMVASSVGETQILKRIAEVTAPKHRSWKSDTLLVSYFDFLMEEAIWFVSPDWQDIRTE